MRFPFLVIQPKKVMNTDKIQARLILITCIGFLPCCLSVVIEFAKWEEHVPFQNMVCPAAIMYSVTSLDRTHCCVICDQVDECLSVFYTPGQETNCHLANVNILSISGCIPEVNATHYSPGNVSAELCNEGGEYRTVALVDGSFTYNVVQASVNRETAQQECAASGGFLAKLSTIPRMEVMFDIMTTCADQGRYWTDGTNVNATDFFAADAWTWKDDTVIIADLWGVDRPNYPGHEHCLTIDSDVGWKLNDLPCDRHINYICEKE